MFRRNSLRENEAIGDLLVLTKIVDDEVILGANQHDGTTVLMTSGSPPA